MMEAPRSADRLREYADLREFHIGEIYGVGKQGNLVIVVTEYLSGGPLGARIGGDWSPLDIAKWLEGIVQALHQAEKATLPHGHLHPGNVLFSSEGAEEQPKICILKKATLDWESGDFRWGIFYKIMRARKQRH